jgi:hypothetical protein
VDQVGRVAQESVHRIEEIPCSLFRPIAVRSDADSCDVHGARLSSMTKNTMVRTVPNRPRTSTPKKSHAYSVSQWLWRNCFQVRLRFAFRRQFDVGFREDVHHRRATDLDLQSAQRVADPGAAPARVVAGKLEHQVADVGGFARPARLAKLRSVIPLRGQLAKPGENRLRAHDQAAGPALLGGQLLALKRQAASLLGVEVDPRLARPRRKRLFENANFFSQILDPSGPSAR